MAVFRLFGNESPLAFEKNLKKPPSKVNNYNLYINIIFHILIYYKEVTSFLKCISFF